MNRRNIKKLTAFAVSAAMLISQSAFAAEARSNGQTSEDYLSQTGNLSRLLTTNNPESYAVIETNGDVVTVKGKNVSDPVYTVFIGNPIDRFGESFKSVNNTEYTAKLECGSLEKGFYKLYIGSVSNRAATYLLKYDNGWSIPDNGLAISNAAKMDKIIEADPAAAAYYISPTADSEEISETFDILKAIVQEVCGDETDSYKKAYLLNKWMAQNIYYDHDAAAISVTLDTVAIRNVLKIKRTTCAGFANTYSALLETAGIRSVNLKGAAAAGQLTYETLTTGRENHEFTAFWYEEQNRWVYADCCWSGAGNYKNGSISEGLFYDKYFDITEEALALDHRIDKVEERHYLKALENADGSASAPEVLDPYHTEKEEISEKFSDISDIEEKEEKTAKNDVYKPVPPSQSGNYAPYIIIALMGVMTIGAGIILALNRRK